MISQADLELFLGIAAGTDTALLIDLEASAVTWVTEETNRYFGASDSYTEYVVGDGTPSLWLEEDPATIPATVGEYIYPGGTATTITASDDDGYVLRGRKLLRKAGLVWYAGYEYVVTYTRGYTQADAGPPADIAAPEDIRQLVKEIVAFWYNGGKRTEASTGLISETIGDYSYARGGVGKDQTIYDALPTAKATIGHYRRIFV